MGRRLSSSVAAPTLETGDRMTTTSGQEVQPRASFVSPRLCNWESEDSDSTVESISKNTGEVNEGGSLPKCFLETRADDRFYHPEVNGDARSLMFLSSFWPTLFI